MSGLPVLPRVLARQDVEDAIAFYVAQGADHAAVGFIDALEAAFEKAGSHPAIGASRWAEELDLPGLRSWSLAEYPFAVFYVERADHVDVWRVLHLRRDLPTTLGMPEGD